MNSFLSFGLNLACDRLDKFDDPLSEVNVLINWESFRHIAEGLYDNKTERGGHPSRMQHSSHQIQEDPATSLEVRKPELAEAKTELGLRKEMSSISGISYTIR